MQSLQQETDAPDSFSCPVCEDKGWKWSFSKNDGTGIGGYSRCDCQSERDLAILCRRYGMPTEFIGKRLDGYKTSNSNERSAVNQALGWLKEMTNTHRIPARGMLYFGAPGCGKTTFACMVMRTVLRRGKTAIFANVPQLFVELRRTMSEGAELSELDIVQKLCEPALLVLDDIAATKPSEYVQNTLYVILNNRYSAGKATIITSDTNGDKLAEMLGARIESRISGMTRPVQLSDKDYRKRTK